MQFIELNGQQIPLTEEGFLTNSKLWSEQLAPILAIQENINLSLDHWRLIYFIRKFYGEHELLPPLRIFIKAVQAEYGKELGNSLTIHKLFSENPMKLLAKIAGLPKPKHCM